MRSDTFVHAHTGILFVFCLRHVHLKFSLCSPINLYLQRILQVYSKKVTCHMRSDTLYSLTPVSYLYFVGDMLILNFLWSSSITSHLPRKNVKLSDVRLIILCGSSP
jgi:hypothetical protein